MQEEFMFYQETTVSVAVEKIICHGQVHRLSRTCQPTCFIGASGRPKYILEHISLPPMLNCVGHLVYLRSMEEWIFVEDSLTSMTKLFSLHKKREKTSRALATQARFRS